jgi:MoxR-like ATPase
MASRKTFDPRPVEVLGSESRPGDSRDGAVYVYDDRTVLAVNVAVATGRPLLVRGPPGCGKSTLAPAVARFLGWRYYEDVISSHTRARDLLWRFDALRRLSDAQVGRLAAGPVAYLEPGVFWWAFDRASARRRGQPPDAEGASPPAEPGPGRDHERAVVLLDEIDKADPDVPNNLLVPLGSLEFLVAETGVRVRALQPPLVFVTTNEERELPRAFLRRCVVLNLPPPSTERLVTIAEAHFGPQERTLYQEVARRVAQLSTASRRGTPAPSTAEYLDTVRACLEMGIKPGAADWEAVTRLTLSKDAQPGEAP